MKKRYRQAWKTVDRETIVRLMSLEAYVGCAGIAVSQAIRSVSDLYEVVERMYGVKADPHASFNANVLFLQEEISKMTRKERRQARSNLTTA